MWERDTFGIFTRGAQIKRYLRFKGMYAHHIIDALRASGLTRDIERKFMRSLLNAQHFDFGEIEGLRHIVNSINTSHGGKFPGYDFKLPFKTCSFSYHEGSDKGLILVREVEQDLFVAHLAVSDVEWFLLYESVIFDGRWGKESLELIFSSPDKPPLDPAVREALTWAGLLLYGFVLILNTKNIGLEKHSPPVPLNKKRIRNGKQPLFTYHTLVLKPLGKKQESVSRHLWDNRIHFQRGHFKVYTKEKPLFGHITGRFWWQAHVRGQNKEGVVTKDYKVEAK